MVCPASAELERLESISGQVAVDGFKLVPHISKETFTYDNENRLLETQTYTQSSTSPAVITSYLYDPMGRLIVTNTDVVDKSTTQIGTIYQGQKPVLQFDMDPDLGNEIQSFKWFDSRGELIASHVNTTHSSQQPHPDELAATWHLNQLDDSEFTNTKSWMATEYVFAANKRGTVNSDPITELQKSTRSWHEGRYALSVESQEAAYRSWADPAHEILNYVGIIDPTGIADGINAVWYIGEGLMGREGAFLNAGISAAGALLPYAGDLLKFGKAGVQAAEACGAIKKLETNVILRQSAKSAAIGAASGAAIGGGISYAAGVDVWHGATQGALHGAVGGFSRNFFLNRYAKACFTAGTPLVVDLEGNSKPIEQIQVGEMVLARNEFEPHGPLELKRVEAKHVRTTLRIALLFYCSILSCSRAALHPFYVPAREAFVPARELQVGDQLISHDGRLLRIDAIHSTSEITEVYNLRVADYHTYFVGGALWGWDVWAHNAICSLDVDQLHAAARRYAQFSKEGKRAKYSEIIGADHANKLKAQQRVDEKAVRDFVRGNPELGGTVPTTNGGRIGRNPGTERTLSSVDEYFRNRGLSTMREFPVEHLSGRRSHVSGRKADRVVIDEDNGVVYVIQSVEPGKNLGMATREVWAGGDLLASKTVRSWADRGFAVEVQLVVRGNDYNPANIIGNNALSSLLQPSRLYPKGSTVSHLKRW